MNTPNDEFPTLSLINDCPFGFLLIDAGGLSWANATLRRWLALPASKQAGIHVQEDLQPHLQRLLDTSSRIQLQAGKPGPVCLKRHAPAQAETAEAARQWYWFSDCSEEHHANSQIEILQSKVEQLDLTDALTGLANRRALSNALVAQVTRSRRYHNPLSLIMVDTSIDELEGPIPDPVLLAISRYLRDRLRWADVIGRHTDTQFMLILPETELEDAQKLACGIRDEVDGMGLPDPHQDMEPRLNVGVVQWNRGQDSERLVSAALEQIET